MKKLLLGLLLAGSAAQAQVFYMPNKGGGEIILTSRACIVDGKNYELAREAYTWSPEVQRLQACWQIIDGNVHVLYLKSNEIRVYRLEDFQVRK
jgi:hypothetical protein